MSPAPESYARANPVTGAASDRRMHIFVGPKSTFSDCDKARDFVTKSGLSFKSLPAEGAETVVTRIGNVGLHGWPGTHPLADPGRRPGGSPHKC